MSFLWAHVRQQSQFFSLGFSFSLLLCIGAVVLMMAVSVSPFTSLTSNPTTQGTYKRISVDNFGEAMLRGMKWKPGDPIGLSNKQLRPLSPGSVYIYIVVYVNGVGVEASQQCAFSRVHPSFLCSSWSMSGRIESHSSSSCCSWSPN